MHYLYVVLPPGKISFVELCDDMMKHVRTLIVQLLTPGQLIDSHYSESHGTSLKLQYNFHYNQSCAMSLAFSPLANCTHVSCYYTCTQKSQCDDPRTACKVRV